VREFKKQSFLAPFFITLEVIMEILIPYVMANIIDIGIKNSNMEYVVKTGLVLLVMAMMSLFFGATGARFAATAAPPVRSLVFTINTLILLFSYYKDKSFRRNNGKKTQRMA